MRLFIFIVVVLCYNPASAQTKVIRAKAYFDVREGKMIEPAVIVIQAGLIQAVNSKIIPDSAEIIDLGDQVLLPGLMDMHVHLDMNMDQNYTFQAVTENASDRTLRATRNAKLTLMAGFTTVRNLGLTSPSPLLIDVALSKASDSGWIDAPRIIPAGHFLSITGGHGDPSMFGGFAQGVMDVGIENGVADGVDDVVKATRYQIKYGAKWIKIIATAGVMTLERNAGAAQYSYAEMKAIVDEATKQGVKVTAHAHGTQGIIDAVNAGVASIEHGSMLNDTAIQLMKEKGVYLVPTTGLSDIIAGSYSKMNPRIVDKAKYMIALAQASCIKAIKANVKIAMGTDAPLVPHGKNALEISALVRRGMKPIDAIRAATINCADLLGVQDRGEIKPGMLADIVAVNGNPLDKIEVLENVKFVMKGGVVYKKEK